MLRVLHVMKREVVKVKGAITIEEAIGVLYEKNIGSVVVTDSENKCIGIYTERDAIRNIANKTSLTTPLGKVMTRKPITLNEEASIIEAKTIMVSHGIRHLPVVNEKGYLVGILTGRSLMEEVIGIPSVTDT